MTIRAEDGHGYVTTSDDGLAWKEPVPWKWDTGEAIAMSSTQQRWLVHSDRLHLVYTRKAGENARVARWRAPLYAAPVDAASLRLVKARERVAVPLVGDGVKEPAKVAHLGNFHTMMVTADESWVTVGEVIPANFRGDLLLARVRWNAPNRLAPRIFRIRRMKTNKRGPRPARAARPDGAQVAAAGVLDPGRSWCLTRPAPRGRRLPGPALTMDGRESDAFREVTRGVRA
jgi:hypothetical protein